jgi:alpha-D-xyloside xylohydrolase
LVAKSIFVSVSIKRDRWSFVDFFIFKAIDMRLFIILFACLISLEGCMKNPEVIISDNGVEFDISKGKMKLEVCREDIIRVMVSPTDTFSSRESLMMIDNPWQKTDFSHKVEGNELVLTTSKLIVKANLTTGQVRFFDTNQNLILAERAKVDRLKPAVVNGEPTWNIRQQWESPADEHLFGLGHHQNGLLNLRGADIDLWQENWEVVVPFFTSSRGYGILWDNYSHSKWGFPVTADFIPSNSVFNINGTQGSLSGNYFTGTSFDDLKTQREDSVISFDFKTFGPQVDNSFTTDPDWVSKPLNPEIDANNFSVRWEGEVESMHAGEYTFHTFCTHSVKLWVNDSLLVDGWNTTDMYLKGKIQLEANTKYPIKVEWAKDSKSPIHGAWNGAIQLRWAPPAQEVFDGITFQSEVGDMVDYYFMYGPELDHVIDGYRSATGKAPLFGKYAYGYWHSHISIQTQKDYLALIKEFRDRKIPLDILVQDLDYWAPAPWGSHDFNADRYPDPEGMIAEAHRNNVKYMISVWGMFQKGSDNWKELMDKDLLFGYNNCSFWTDKGTWYYNPFSKEGREVYWDQMNRGLFSKGVDAWWLDASEPEISTPADPFLYKKVMDNNLGSGARYLNAFSLMQTKGIYEGQRQTAPDKRVLILGRSAYAGQQRNATVVWTGDIAGTWDVFKTQITCGQNFSLSGLPYWTTDIGGFFINAPDWPLLNKDPGYRELYTRWFQYGTFCPILRTHGSGPRREMWIMGEESMNVQIAFDHFRYRLLPYIYSLAGAVTHDNSTIMRALVMDFPDDKAAIQQKYQYMFGPSFMVCPVVESGIQMQTNYLPEGASWIDFWTGESFGGGTKVDKAVPLDIMPLYVRAGSIVPLGPFMQYATEKLADPLELRVYPGADGTFTLYEDEGENYNYEKGQFSKIDFVWNDEEKMLTIGAREGEYKGMLTDRSFNIILVQPNWGVGIDEPGKYNKTVVYTGDEVVIKL